jgi:hypothetical protein
MRLRGDYYEPGIAALPRLSLPLDADDYTSLRRRYLERGAWTWFADYQPPATMEYVEIMHEGQELLRPVAVRPVSRELRILARHARKAPSVLQRLVSAGRLREP